MATELGTLLPTCEAFEGGGNSSSVVTKNDSEPLQCYYQFEDYCGVCIPLCGTFSQYPDQVKFVERSFIILYAVLAIFGGIIMFIGANVSYTVCMHSACVFMLYPPGW